MAIQSATPESNLETWHHRNAAVLCAGGKVVSSAKLRRVARWLDQKHRKKIIEIDCGSKVVLPGFVDSHTHPAFISPRLVTS